MTAEKQQAKDMYMNTSSTQVQIAQAVGVTPKTINRWVKQESWDQLKKATLAMPAMIVGNLFAQIAELQQHINSREEGARFPTVAEAEVIRRLINAAHKMGVANSMNTNVQVMMSFSDYTMRQDHEFTQKLVRYADAYFRDQLGKQRSDGFPFTLFFGTKPPVPDPVSIEEMPEPVPETSEQKEEPVNVHEQNFPEMDIPAPASTQTQSPKGIQPAPPPTPKCPPMDTNGHYAHHKPPRHQRY